MGTYSGYIIVMLVVLKIASSIFQQYQRGQQRRAAMEAAARRQPDVESPATERPPQPVAEARGSSVNASDAELEKRRKAQLEQLRQRREGRRGGVPVGGYMGGVMGIAPGGTLGGPSRGILLPQAGFPTRLGRASPNYPGPPTQPTQPARRGMQTTTPTIGTSDQSRMRDQLAEREQRTAERQRREQQARATVERDILKKAAAEQRTAQASIQTQRTAQAVAVAAATSAADVADRTGIGQVILTRQLHEHGALRQAIVLREILDRPVALREPPPAY